MLVKYPLFLFDVTSALFNLEYQIECITSHVHLQKHVMPPQLSLSIAHKLEKKKEYGLNGISISSSYHLLKRDPIHWLFFFSILSDGPE